MREFTTIFVIVVALFLASCNEPVKFGRLHPEDDTDRAVALRPEPTFVIPPTQEVALSAPSRDEVAFNQPTDPLIQVQCSRDTLATPIKILFVVDTSGSNFYDYKGKYNYVPATDPLKKFRGSSISQFFERYKDKENFSWGFETFSKDKADQPVFGSAANMQKAIDDFKEDRDKGNTPYLKALNQVRQALASDPDMNSASSSTLPPRYYVIFMSDGYPTDSTMTQIRTEVESITSLNRDRISFSTLYYATRFDRGASITLQNMSVVGHGQSVNVDTTKTDTFDIQDLINLPTISCISPSST